MIDKIIPPIGSITKGGSQSRPPFSNGSNYNF